MTKHPAVADELRKLTFTARHVASMYLNHDRVHEQFVGLLGSMAAQSRSIGKEGGGSLNLGFGQAAGKATKGDQIQYDLKDPIAQALLLREQLSDQGSIVDVETALAGQYVLVVGRSCLRRVGSAFDHPGDHGSCPAPEGAAYLSLERVREMEEATQRAFGGDDVALWLLVLADVAGRITAASVLNQRWVNPDAVSSYQHLPWEVFGTVLPHRAEGIPLLVPIHVIARMDLQTSSNPSA